MKNILIVCLLVVMLLPVTTAGAQSAPYVVASTKPISSELRGWLDAWLAVSAPSDAPYYIVTYWRERNADYFVSLVGAVLDSPDQPWSLEEPEKTIWMGSVLVNKTSGEVSPFSSNPPQASGKVAGLANLRLAAGGGGYVMFPFQQGASAMYGPRGVHGSGDYGTSGMLFVDLVSGDDMGVTAAGPQVYAADAGEIDYVCDDGTTVAVRTYNADTGDYFLYAHLLDNANLVENQEFSQGEMIGALKYGSFDPPDPNCGWAEQHANHYHVHWGFVPAGGTYQVGACILTISTQTWLCGEETVRVGGFLVNSGSYTGSSGTAGTSGSSGTNDNASTAVRDPTFFDYILAALLQIGYWAFGLLPSHEPFRYTLVITNVIEMFFRMVYVFIQSNVSLKFVMQVVSYAIGVKVSYFIISIIPLIFRAIKWLFPAA